MTTLTHLPAGRSRKPSGGSRSWLVAALTGMVWLLVGVSLAYWVWRWWGHVPLQNAPVATRAAAEVDPAVVAQALGAGRNTPVVAAPAQDASSAVVRRLALVGVAQDAQGHGVALIAQDGKPAQPWRVGAALGDGWTLHALQGQQAVLAREGGGQARLSLPAKAAGLALYSAPSNP